MLLVLFISAVGLSIALSNAPSPTGAVSTTVIPPVQVTSSASPVSCASHTPCAPTFAGMQQCRRLSDRYQQQGISNAMACASNCCIIIPR